MRIDLKNERKDLYAPPTADFVEVDVPSVTYLAIDGHGDPNTSSTYADAVGALYTAGYGVRAAFKERTGDDFVVGPLEALWTSSDPETFVRQEKSAWDWTLLIALPDAVSSVDANAGITHAAQRKSELPVGEVEPRVIAEGRSLQIMHVGSYDDEGPTLARLHHEVMPALGVTWNGPHHEIYLSDPRRVAPEKLRTVLRQPVIDAVAPE
ncbi:GyrI-like domain-containing protein [Propioniciclava soli]|uniref:GyrI-like domain-containing protein n=1 Tax=Propioniciclava soli TaxID=2775081 RepID=UPI001E4D61B4